MSDTVIIAIVTGVCTALPLILAQVVSIIKASRRMDEAALQMAQVKTAVEETKVVAKEAKKATVTLQEGQNFMAASLATNTHDTNQIRKDIANYVVGNTKPGELR